MARGWAWDGHYCRAPANFLLAPGLHRVPGSGCAKAGARGPQSDDVVESTTSRPLQTVGTNWEPDPGERELEMGADPEGLQRGRAAGAEGGPPTPPSPVPGQGASAAQGAEEGVRADADLGRGWSWPWPPCCRSGWWARGG